MLQKVEIVIKIKSDFFDEYNEKTLIQVLNQHRKNRYTTFKIINLFNNSLTIKINTCLPASWNCNKKNSWAYAAWSWVFKPFGTNLVWGHRILSFKREVKI